MIKYSMALIKWVFGFLFILGVGFMLGGTWEPMAVGILYTSIVIYYHFKEIKNFIGGSN